MVQKEAKDSGKEALTSKFHVNVPDPVSASFLLPVALHVQVV